MGRKVRSNISMPYALYISKPLVEPFDNFDESQLDIESNFSSNENMDLGFDGNSVPNNGMLSQLYISRPIVFEKHSNIFGDKKSRQSLKDKLKKDLHDASVNISNTSHDAAKNVSETTTAAANRISKKIGDKLGGGIFVHSVNKYDPYFIAARGAIQAMFLANVVGIGHAMWLIKSAKDQNHWNQIKQKWWMWGGEKNVLDSTVDRGNKKKAFAQELFDKKKNFDGGYDNASSANPSDNNPSTNTGDSGNVGKVVAKAATTLGIATPILAGFTYTLPASVWTGTGATAMATLTPIIKSFSKSNGASDADTANLPPPVDMPNAQVPTDPAQLAKIQSEIDNVSPDDAEAAARVASRNAKIASGTYTSDDAKADDAFFKKSADDSKKIMGMPKNIAYGVFALIGVVVIVGGIMILKHKKTPAI